MRIDPKVIELIKSRYYKNAEWSFDEYRKCFVHTEDEFKKALALVCKHNQEHLEYYIRYIIPWFKDGGSCYVNIATKLIRDLTESENSRTKKIIKKEITGSFPDLEAITLLDNLFHSVVKVEMLSEKLKSEKTFVERTLETINIKNYDTI